jgi:hypothetical protein
VLWLDRLGERLRDQGVGVIHVAGGGLAVAAGRYLADRGRLPLVASVWRSGRRAAVDILREIRRQGGLSIACHPHHRTTRRIEISTCYLWDHREELSDLVDVWEAANRDDLFSVTSLKHYPYVASSDFHKPKLLYSWKPLLRCEKTWPDIKRALRSNVDIALTLFRNGEWTC